jgi:hypothetical protein
MQEAIVRRPYDTARSSSVPAHSVRIAEESQRARVREICITDQVANNVGSIEPSLWVISGQKFDRAQPALLILPVRLQIILTFRSQDRQDLPVFSDSLRQNSRYKDGTTKACTLAFLAVPYRALQSDRCLVITT